MGAFVLFLIFIYVNENNAITPNEIEIKRDTFPLNIESEVLPTNSNKLRIRRYQDIEPFFQEMYYETPQHIDNRVLTETPRYYYNDIHKTDSGRFYLEDIPFQNTISHRDAYLITQKDPEIYSPSPRREYINYGIQYLNPYREIQNADIPKFREDIEGQKSKAKEYYLADSTDLGYYFRENREKVKDSPVIYSTNKTPRKTNKNDNVDYRNMQNTTMQDAHNLENRKRDTIISQIPFRSEFAIEDYPYLPQYNSFYDAIIPLKVEPGIRNTNNVFSDKARLDKTRSYSNIQPDGNFLLNLKTPSEPDDINNNTPIKHSLTSSDSAVENRLLTSHIKRTSEKVKDDAVNSFLIMPKLPFSKSQFNENMSKNLYDNKFQKPEQKKLEHLQPCSSSTPINNHQQYKSEHSEIQPLANIPSISSSDRTLSTLNKLQTPIVNQQPIETTREDSHNFRKLEVTYPTNLPKPNEITTRKQIVTSQNNVEKYVNDITSTQETLSANNPFETRKDPNQDIKHINKSHSDKPDMIKISPEIIKPSPKNPNNIQHSAPYKEMDKNRIGNHLNTPATYVSQLQPDLTKYKSIGNTEINNNIPTTFESVNYGSLGRPNIPLVENNRHSIVQNPIKAEMNGLSYKNPSAHGPGAEILNIYQLSKDNESWENYSPTPQTVFDISLNQNIKEERGIIHSPPINVIPTIQTANYQQDPNNIKSTYNTPITTTAAPTYAVQALNYYEINKPKVTVVKPQIETQKNIKVHQLPSSYYMSSFTYPQFDSTIVPNVETLSQNHTIFSPQPCKAKVLIDPLSTSLNKLASVIVTDILANLNKNISKALQNPDQASDVSKWPVSPPIATEISTFEVTHPCIESPRCLPETLIKQRSENGQTTNKSSKAYVSTITINVLPQVQQKSNDIIIVV